MNSFYWKPPFKPAREGDLLSSLMTENVGEQKYHGDFVPSGNWPNVAPGKFGPINALSPKYVGDSVQKFIGAQHKPFILWVRGDSDMIVSDNSFFDFGTLGRLGYVPGWPGEEVVIADAGHTPYIEKPEEFMAALSKALR